MRTGVRTIGLAAVLVLALMAALATWQDAWSIRMTEDGAAGLTMLGLLVAFVGASLILPSGRRRA